MDRKLKGPQSLSGWYGKERNLVPCCGIEYLFVGLDRMN
jgi:hypothetical protein